MDESARELLKLRIATRAAAWASLAVYHSNIGVNERARECAYKAEKLLVDLEAG